MNQRELQRALRDVPLPEEHEARERSWRVVRMAYAERQPRASSPSAPKRLTLALAVAAVILAVVLTPAGAKVVDLVNDAVTPGARHAEPALTRVPGGGSLLVGTGTGPWVVNADGSKRALGDYAEAAWSAGGHFVAVADGHELKAVEPTGTDAVRWAIPSERRVTRPSWSTSGVKIAYLSGRSLRVVAGDGTGDQMLARRVGAVTPEWQPQRRPLPPSGQVYGPHTNLLAYATAGGRVVVASVRRDNSAEVIFRSADRPRPQGLAWSSDGKRLLSFTSRAVSTYDPSSRGRYPTFAGMPKGTLLRGVAFQPGTHRVAAIATRRSGAGARSALFVGRPDVESFGAQPALSDPGRFTDVAWSPGGDWILIGWADADQWLFINPASDRVMPVANITEQFGSGATSPLPFPRVAGWCCTAQGASSP